MDHITSPWEPAERVEHVRELAARGDLAALSHVLLHPQDSWHEGLGVTTVLRGLPERDRSALARLFTEHRAGESADSPADDRGLVLLAAVSHGIAEDGWCEAWEALLTGMAEELWSSGISDELWTCAHALLDAGRRLPAEVVALLRRPTRTWDRQALTLTAPAPPGGPPPHTDPLAHPRRPRRRLRPPQPPRPRRPHLAPLPPATPPHVHPHPERPHRGPTRPNPPDRHRHTSPVPLHRRRNPGQPQPRQRRQPPHWWVGALLKP